MESEGFLWVELAIYDDCVNILGKYRERDGGKKHGGNSSISVTSIKFYLTY